MPDSRSVRPTPSTRPSELARQFNFNLDDSALQDSLDLYLRRNHNRLVPVPPRPTEIESATEPSSEPEIEVVPMPEPDWEALLTTMRRYQSAGSVVPSSWTTSIPVDPSADIQQGAVPIPDVGVSNTPYERKHKESTMQPDLLEKASDTMQKEFKPNSRRPQPFTRNTYGFEIEFFCTSWRRLEQLLERAGLSCVQSWYRNGYDSTWFIHGDGSLHCSDYGFSDTELNSPPLQHPSGLDDLAKACDVIQELDWEVNRTCGLHLHIGASRITPAQYIRLIHFYYHYEAAIDKMMPEGRRGNNNSYCHGLQNESFARVVENFLYPSPEYWQRDTLWDHMPRERYSKLGITSAYHDHTTIEFRHHEGTVDYEDMHYWMRFITAIVDKSKSPHFHPSGDRDNLCHALQELNLEDYVSRYLLAKSYKYEIER